MKGGIIAGFLFAFLISFEELTVALFIGAGVKSTLPKQMWDNVLLNVEPTLAVASIIVAGVGISLFLVAELFRGGNRSR